jgi:hypothetical protein
MRSEDDAEFVPGEERHSDGGCELKRWLCGELTSRSGCWSDSVKVTATMEM